MSTKPEIKEQVEISVSIEFFSSPLSLLLLFDISFSFSHEYVCCYVSYMYKID